MPSALIGDNMKIKNTSAKLIRLRTTTGKIDFLPAGGPVEISDEQAETDFIQSHLTSGDLVEITAQDEAREAARALKKAQVVAPKKRSTAKKIEAQPTS